MPGGPPPVNLVGIAPSLIYYVDEGGGRAAGRQRSFAIHPTRESSLLSALPTALTCQKCKSASSFAACHPSFTHIQSWLISPCLDYNASRLSQTLPMRKSRQVRARSTQAYNPRRRPFLRPMRIGLHPRPFSTRVATNLPIRGHRRL